MGGTAFEARLDAFLASLGPGGVPASGPAAAAARLVRADPATRAFARIGVDLSPVAGQRIELLRGCASLCPAVSLEVAGHAVQARLSPAELWRFYLPVCQAVAALSKGAGARTLVGIAGPGGSGKSVFAGLLSVIMQGGFAGAGPGVALCTMDGFHYPNAHLDSHFARDAEGRRVSLRALKGTPDTFDADGFVRCLRELRAGRSVTVPRYDRRLHDPVADGPRIGPDRRVVLVEGNYLLLDDGAWAGVAGLLDLRLFLTLPAEALREAMIRRHVRGGRSREDAARHFERVDGPNGRLIMSTAHRADLVVRRDAAGRVVGVEGPRGRDERAGPIETGPAP